MICQAPPLIATSFSHGWAHAGSQAPELPGTGLACSLLRGHEGLRVLGQGTRHCLGWRIAACCSASLLSRAHGHDGRGRRGKRGQPWLQELVFALKALRSGRVAPQRVRLHCRICTGSAAGAGLGLGGQQARLHKHLAQPLTLCHSCWSVTASHFSYQQVLQRRQVSSTSINTKSLTSPIHLFCQLSLVSRTHIYLGGTQ